MRICFIVYFFEQTWYDVLCCSRISLFNSITSVLFRAIAILSRSLCNASISLCVYVCLHMLCARLYMCMSVYDYIQCICAYAVRESVYVCE